MNTLIPKSNHVTIGYFTCSGNICPEDGIYIAHNDNLKIVCLRGEAIPKIQGVEVGVELIGYLPKNIIKMLG